VTFSQLILLHTLLNRNINETALRLRNGKITMENTGQKKLKIALHRVIMTAMPYHYYYTVTIVTATVTFAELTNDTAPFT